MMQFSVLRKLVALTAAFTLAFTTLACSSSFGDSEAIAPADSPTVAAAPSPTTLPDGKYPVQQASYNDLEGDYTLMLLNTPPGKSSVFQSADLPMARLTDEEISAGEKSYLKVENGQPSLHLTEDFRIEYIHNVTETQVNSQTGQQEVVVVRQEPSFWSPFAGALAGQALGSLLFTPHYYFPPVYVPGRVMTGYGSYGRTYGQAVERYQAQNKTVPNAVRNRQLRTSGQLRAPSATRPTTARPKTSVNRPSGSGFGSNTLRPNAAPRPKTTVRPGGGFGSVRPRPSFGGGMRGGGFRRR